MSVPTVNPNTSHCPCPNPFSTNSCKAADKEFTVVSADPSGKVTSTWANALLWTPAYYVTSPVWVPLSYARDGLSYMFWVSSQKD